MRSIGMDSPIVTVWFDGACPLCRREIGWMRRLDRAARLHFVDLADSNTACPLDRSILLSRLHARVGDGPLLVGADAFAAMWRAVPVLRPLGLLAAWRPVGRLLGWAYERFLRVRPRLQALCNRGGS